jgi:hypothetical protein
MSSSMATAAARSRCVWVGLPAATSGAAASVRRVTNDDAESTLVIEHFRIATATDIAITIATATDIAITIATTIAIAITIATTIATVLVCAGVGATHIRYWGRWQFIESAQTKAYLSQPYSPL